MSYSTARLGAAIITVALLAACKQSAQTTSEKAGKPAETSANAGVNPQSGAPQGALSLDHASWPALPRFAEGERADITELEEFLYEEKYAPFALDANDTSTSSDESSSDCVKMPTPELKNGHVVAQLSKPCASFDSQKGIATISGSKIAIDAKATCAGIDEGKVRTMIQQGKVELDKACGKDATISHGLWMRLTADVLFADKSKGLEIRSQIYHHQSEDDGRGGLCQRTKNGSDGRFDTCTIEAVTAYALVSADEKSRAQFPEVEKNNERWRGVTRNVVKKEGARFPRSGKIELEFNGWKGAVTFKGDNTPPTFRMEDGKGWYVETDYPVENIRLQRVGDEPDSSANSDSSAGPDMGLHGDENPFKLDLGLSKLDVER